MNRPHSRQHTRNAARRANARLVRARKLNARKIDRAARITKGNSFRHSSKGDTPSDIRRAKARARQ